MTNQSAVDEVKSVIDAIGKFFVREYAAAPDSGQAVTADVRALFDRVCNAAQILEFIDEECEATGCTDPVVAHDGEGVPLCQGCYDQCVEDSRTD